MCFIYNCFWRGGWGGGLLLGLSPCCGLCPGQGVWLGSALALSPPAAAQPSCGLGGGMRGREDPECRTWQHTETCGDGSAGRLPEPGRGRASHTLVRHAAPLLNGWQGCAGPCRAAATAAAFSHRIPKPGSVRDASASIRLAAVQGPAPSPSEDLAPHHPSAWLTPG